jgi:hypothetical protein
VVQVRCAIDFKSLDALLTFLEQFSKKCASEVFISACSISNVDTCLKYSRDLTIFTVGSDQLAVDGVEGRVLRILRLRNRFSNQINADKQLLGGYRDIGMKLQIGFTLKAHGDVKFVPCCQWSDKSCKFKVILLLLLVHL